MLPLLPSVLFNKISDRQFFLQKIVLLVFFVHIFLLSSMIFLSMVLNKEDKFTILMHQAGATYVLMPLQKKIDQKNRSSLARDGSVSKKSQVLNYEDYLQKKRSQKARKHSMQQIKKSSVSAKKNQKSTAKLRSKASAMIASFKKENKNKKNKNNKKNKIKLMAQQEELQKKLDDPAEIEQKKIESQQVEKAPMQENQQETNQEKKKNDFESLEQDEPSLEDVIFVGYEQFDECVISSKIQQAVVTSWTPPVGIDAGTACEMKIKVSVQGMADAVEIIKSSGVLLYDTSARTALLQVEFPKEVHGKIIRIVLGN